MKHFADMLVSQSVRYSAVAAVVRNTYRDSTMLALGLDSEISRKDQIVHHYPYYKEKIYTMKPHYTHIAPKVVIQVPDFLASVVWLDLV
jgi:hypothetical protein